MKKDKETLLLRRHRMLCDSLILLATLVDFSFMSRLLFGHCSPKKLIKVTWGRVPKYPSEVKSHLFQIEKKLEQTQRNLTISLREH